MLEESARDNRTFMSRRDGWPLLMQSALMHMTVLSALRCALPSENT